MIETQDTPRAAPSSERSVASAMRRGLAQRCPACGDGALYKAYLKVADECPACGEALHHHRADDAPPYFTMLITGHVVVAGVMLLEDLYQPDLWVHVAVWGPLLLAMTLVLLPRVKGALVGLQWALRMHGFGAGDPIDKAAVDPAHH